MLQVKHYKYSDALVKDDISFMRFQRESVDGYVLSTCTSEHSENGSLMVTASFEIIANSLTHRYLTRCADAPCIVVETQPLSIYFDVLEDYLQFCEFFAIDAQQPLIDQFNQTAAAKA
jgi:hypothetical protein